MPFLLISLISLIFRSRCTSFGLDTLISGKTFRVASDLFRSPSISSNFFYDFIPSLLFKPLARLQRDRFIDLYFTGKPLARPVRGTYLVGVRSGASISGTGW